MSVNNVKGKKTANANLGGNTSTIKGNPKPPKPPPNPDFDIETNITAKILTGINTSNWLIILKPSSACSNKCQIPSML